MNRFSRYLSIYNCGSRKYIEMELLDFELPYPSYQLTYNGKTNGYELYHDGVNTALLKANGRSFDLSRKDKIWWYKYFSSNRAKMFFIDQKPDKKFYISFLTHEN